MKRLTIVLTAFAFAGTGCGDPGARGSTEPPPPPPATVASVTVTPAASALAIGGTVQLAASVQDAAGHVLGGHAVAWESSGPGIAAVSTSGMVTAVAAGSTTITATSEGRSGSASVTVLPPAVATVTLSPPARAILVGGSQQLTATVLDATGQPIAGRHLDWTTSDATMATVDPAGLVVGVGVGTATITASIEAKAGAATIMIVPATTILSDIREPDAFMNLCPTSDSMYDSIRQDFQLLSDGVPSSVAVTCTDPYTSTPTLTDELALTQTLRMVYYMSRGSAGRLPWTSSSLYDWLKSQIAGVNLHAADGNSYCCDYINGRPYVGISRGKLAILVWRDWATMLGAVALLAHEARHVQGPGHTTGCPEFPLPTDPLGCDATYDPPNLGSYGIQYWLYAGWATGTIDIGIGCLPAADAQAGATTAAGMANSYLGRFVSNPPSRIVPAAPFGGVCNP
jgi:Bacterial Ig-like domain (group 2)